LEQEETVLSKARRASNAAIERVLLEDQEKDDGEAIPSDVWLDRGSAFDEMGVCRRAAEIHRVPTIVHKLAPEDAELALLVTRKQQQGNETSEPDEHADQKARVFWNDLIVRESSTSAENDDQSVGTAQSGATNATRRLKRRARHRNAAGERNNAATGKREAALKSPAYLCELLHDTYGASGSARKAAAPMFLTSEKDGILESTLEEEGNLLSTTKETDMETTNSKSKSNLDVSIDTNSIALPDLSALVQASLRS